MPKQQYNAAYTVHMQPAERPAIIAHSLSAGDSSELRKSDVISLGLGLICRSSSLGSSANRDNSGNEKEFFLIKPMGAYLFVQAK